MAYVIKRHYKVILLAGTHLVIWKEALIKFLEVSKGNLRGK